MRVSDPRVQLAPACSLISQHDPCCCTDTLTLTQRNQRDSFKCLSVSAGDQCFLWREHQHRRGGSGEGEWRQESEWMGGERRRMGREVRKVTLYLKWLMDDHRQRDTIFGGWVTSDPIRLYVRTTAHIFVLKPKERETERARDRERERGHEAEACLWRTSD